MLDRINSFLFALFCSSLIVNVVLIISPYRAYYDSPPREHGRHEANQDEGAGQPTKDRPTVQIECDPNCSTKNSDENRNDGAVTRFFRKTLDDPLAAFTAILTIATIGLAFGVLFQIKDARASSERQLRAYVFISGARVVNATEGDGPLEAHVVVKNFGQTPAYKLVNVNGFALDRYPPPPTLNLVVPEEQFRMFGRSKSDLGPTQSEDARQAVDRPPLSEEERRALAHGALVIYVYGEIRYQDAFGRDQWTKYRLMLGGPAGVRPGGRLAPCEDGNEAK
jgi:hypothetical protein